MQLKEYQQRALSVVRSFLDHLAEWRRKARDNPDLEIDFPSKAWEKAGIQRPFISSRDGLGRPLPTFCLKIPTGGGKTLLAVKTIDLVNAIYLNRRTGLVLWIVPTTQIYKQTIESLRDRGHPYRQHLDLASGGHTLIKEKTDRFSPQDLKENLVVLMLMLPSANRQTKEVLRVFKDSGGFQDFFPPEDDLKAQGEALAKYPNLDTYENGSAFWGKQVKTSLGNTLRMVSPLVILDEGHKAYSKGAQETLRGFNPSLMVELSATPTKGNVLVDIGGRELLREEMIKLDLHVVNKASPDWKDTLMAAVDKRNVLEILAREFQASTGTYIRPICLIQVERTGKDQQGGQWIHSEQVREHLIRTVGISSDEIAIKTSEKDELKEADDSGGLMAKDCNIRYVITKQALQEGWDCPFAYVLAILTNPRSKNALTQLVGRILRQPYARKTRLRDLDESYVLCFQQRGKELLESIKSGFEREGLGDLRRHVVTLHERDEAEAGERCFEVQERFRQAARRTILPVFMIRGKDGWRPVSYEMDIASRIPWESVDLKPVLSLTLSMYDKKDVEVEISLGDDRHRPIEASGYHRIEQSGIRVDPVFMTRQLCDIVANPWQAHEFSRRILTWFREKGGDSAYTEGLIANNFVFLIEELRKQLECEKDRLAEQVFRSMLERGELRFLIIGNNFDWSFPKSMSVKASSRTLSRKDGTPLQLSLFGFTPEDDFNDTEKAVAWYLDTQSRLFFWFRNRARHDYCIQGWRQHRIYPDFIFTSAAKEAPSDFDRVYVVETKGLHLKDNSKTDYIRKVFDICTRQAKSKKWNQFGPAMKDKILHFDVLSEEEWQAKLNSILVQ